MEKKICPWCGKEMEEDCFGDYHCLCNKDIQTSLMDNEELVVLISGVEIDNLIAMKAEHAKLKAENEQLKKTPVMHCGEIYFIKADEEEVNRILEENEKWKDRIKIVQNERNILKSEAERTRWHSVADNDLPTKEQEENKEYLVQTKYGYCIAKLLGEFVTIESGEEFYELYFEDFDDWEDIIAWSELSQPYKNN